MSVRHPPLTDQPAVSLAVWSERQLLERLREWLAEAAPAAPEGMGDDTAVLRPPAEQGAHWNLLTTDSLVYGRHWDDTISPELAGAKLLKRNLSDLAAMGGQPGPAVMAAFLPPQLAQDWLAWFVAGLRSEAQRWGVKLCGGDLTETQDFLGFNLTLQGYAPRPVLRTGARAGDWIYVTGQLGGSLSSAHHATFAPRLREGQWLAAQPETISMIDLTDGLAKDLPALVSPGLAASIRRGVVPVRGGLPGITAERQAWTDGEDYELLFTWRGEPRRLENAWAEAFPYLPLTCLGRMWASAVGPVLDEATRQPWLPEGGGFEHFRRA